MSAAATGPTANRLEPVSARLAGQFILGGLLLTLLAWLGTYFPWVATGPTAFSVNLYDLAEWSSLNPFVRDGTVTLLAPFCLRAAVGLLAFILALQSAAVPNRALRSLLRVLALLIGIGLLPPFDFFRGQAGDPNYRQQFIVALVTCLAVLAAWRGTNWLVRTIADWLAFVASLTGLILGLQAMTILGLHVAPGGGGVITVIAAFVLTGQSLALTPRPPNPLSHKW